MNISVDSPTPGLPQTKIKEPLAISLVNTKKCNFHCTYCYEQGQFEDKEISKEDTEEFLDFLIEQSKDHSIALTFIGGEPTLSKNTTYLLQKMIPYLENKSLDIQKFHIITNGSSFSMIEKLFGEEFLSKFKHLIEVQVSYDGKAIHDLTRIQRTSSGVKGTADKVKNTIELLLGNGYRVSIKSTLDINHLDKVPEVLREFRELNLKYKNYLDKEFFYSPTEDKGTISKMKPEEIQKLLKSSFKEIIEEEKINLRVFGRPLTSWFRNYSYEQPAKFCPAGIQLYAVNYKLEMGFCHHMDYISDKNNLMKYGTIDKESRENTLKNFNKMKEFYKSKENVFLENEACKNCEAVYCMKCPIEQYSMMDEHDKISRDSLEDMYKEYYYDSLCFYYKEISKIIHYFNKKIINQIGE